MPDTPRLVTKQQAAALLGVSLRTVERRIRAGDLAPGPPLHTKHGAQTRVYVVAPPDGPPTADAALTPDAAPDTAALVTPTKGPDIAATDPGAVALAALRLVDEVMRENAALRARLDEQTRARDTAVAHRALQWLTGVFRRGGGDGTG